jgi:hypothetical protein
MFANTGAHAIQIAAAAQDAVKRFPHFNLGSADINRIVAQTSYGSLSIAERLNMAQNLAQDAAKAWLEAQAKRNIVDDPHHKPNAGVYAFGGTFGGMAGFGRFAGFNDARSGGASSGSGPNSGTYSREFGHAALNNSFNALLTEGYSKAQLNAVMPYAKALGWHDKEGLGALAGSGREYAGMAAALHRARQRGDTAAEEQVKKRMREYREKRKGKETPREKRDRDKVDRRLNLSSNDAHTSHGNETARDIANNDASVSPPAQKAEVKASDARASTADDVDLAAVGVNPTASANPVKAADATKPPGATPAPAKADPPTRTTDAGTPAKGPVKAAQATQLKPAGPSVV